MLLPLLFLQGCGSPPVEEITANPNATSAAPPLASVAQEDWPWWRGPTLDGHAAGPVSPLEWSSTKNVIWSSPIPGRGHATPTIWQNQIFVATADKAAETMSLICYSREDGRELWNREIHKGGFMHIHDKNSHASSTPACDGKFVYCTFMVQGGIWVTAVDLEGIIAWQSKVSGFGSKHGYGSSPLLHDTRVIVPGDNHSGGFLAAVDRASGDVVWRVARKNTSSFASPVIAKIGGKEQILLSGQDEIVSYEPKSGEVLWKTKGPASTTANTMVWNQDLVFASGGYPQRSIMAVKADGSGTVVWEQRNKVYVPSMLLIKNHLLAIQDDGIARCFKADSGDEIWSKRLGGNFSASPTVVGDYVMVPSESGTMYVFKPLPKFELVSENSLDSAGFASPVICNGRLYLRTDRKLYCIGNTEAS